jgi:ATP-dependent protease ClpP protease subunit
MTNRSLPKIEAFARPGGIDFDPPVKAAELWTPVKAASEDERALAITGRIGEDWDGSGMTLAYVRGFLRRVGAGPVTINVNSPGGDFFEGAAIYNQLREHDGPVTVNVMGLAASAASVIAFASDTLRVAKAGFLMIHNSWGIVLGNRHDMTDAAELFAKFDATMAGVYSDRSGIDRKKVAAMMDKETFFTGEEAVAAGMADDLLASDQVEEDEEAPTKAAYRRLDKELALQGMPRAERRALLSEVSGGTPCAAADVTPCADDQEAVALLHGLTSILKSE